MRLIDSCRPRRPDRGAIRFVGAIALLVLLAGLAGAQSSDTLSLEQQLEHARELSTSAPWRETKDVLDRIEPRLEHSTPEQRAEFWLIRARNRTLAGDLQTALDQVRNLLEMPMTPGQEVRAYSLAANITTFLRRWEETFEYLNRGLALAGQLGPSPVKDRPFGLAAYIYAKIGETDQAIEYGKRAMDIALEYGSLRDVCINQGRLAFVHKTANQFDEARRHYRQAIERCLGTDDELVIGTIESGLADLLRASGDFEQAEGLFQQALSRLRETEYQYGLAEARFYKARLHWERDEPGQAEELLRQALPALETDQAWDYLAEAFEMLGKIAAEREEHERALEYVRRQLNARERYLDLERARQLAYLQVAFDMRSREQELALLREQRRVSELQVESRRQRERLRWLAYGFGALLFVVLILLLVRVLRERRHFRRLAGLDSLTTLNNHTRFFDTARTMVNQAQHERRPMVLALCDIDFFKRVNDEFGHITGDRALQEVARLLRDLFPAPANIGRIGGEEFALSLPGQTARDVLPRIEAFREALANTEYGGSGKPLTMSFGLAELQPDEALEDLRGRADDALYHAKNSGRNSVVVADGDPGEA